MRTPGKRQFTEPNIEMFRIGTKSGKICSYTEHFDIFPKIGRRLRVCFTVTSENSWNVSISPETEGDYAVRFALTSRIACLEGFDCCT